jgi:hypothetical protein
MSLLNEEDLKNLTLHLADFQYIYEEYSKLYEA